MFHQPMPSKYCLLFSILPFNSVPYGLCLYEILCSELLMSLTLTPAHRGLHKDLLGLCPPTCQAA